MDKISTVFETYQRIDDELISIARLASVSLEDDGVRVDIAKRLQVIDRQLALEELRDVKNSLKDALSAVKETVKRGWSNAKEVTDKIAVAFDDTESKHLEVAERRLANTRGNLPSGATLNDRKIADMLHVNGRVPNDPKSFLTPLIAMVRKVRTETVPEMHKSLVETGTFLMNAKPIHSPPEYHDIVERVANDAVNTGDLLTAMGIEELKKLYPGGLCLTRESGKTVNIDYANRIAGQEAQELVDRIEAINKANIKLVRNPAEKCPEATTSVVPLLNAQAAAVTLKLVKDLIAEGRFLAGYRPNDGGGFYPSQTIGWALGEITKFAQQVGIDANDRATAHLCADYYESTMMQYHLLPSSVCRIAFDTANATIRWVEESIKRYK